MMQPAMSHNTLAQAPLQMVKRPAQPTLALQDIRLMSRGRHMLLGMSGSGKSTVMAYLIRDWTDQQPKPRVLILDSKPRFRAEWELNGLRATHRYKRWRRGEGEIPGSVALDLSGRSGSLRAQLKQAWSLHHQVAIIQTPEQSELEYLRRAAHWFYADANDSYSQLLVVDELADFFGTSGAASRGDSLLKVVRSGREMNIAFLGGAQRPKGIPYSFLTEVSAVYLFKLKRKQDREHLDDLGIDANLTPSLNDHRFYYVNDYSGRSGYARMNLPK